MGEQIDRQPRTLLERLIRERNQTLEEFVASLDVFAREHGESGTLSLRHLQRLIAGRHPDGRTVGRPRPATARLLERVLGEPIDRLLGKPSDAERGHDELRARMAAARGVDQSMIELLHVQLNGIRRIDRQLGAVVAYDETQTKIRQVQELMAHSLMPERRQQLAALLAELGTLAGWQALDLGQAAEAWRHYEVARAAAAITEAVAYEAHVMAEQAFVLVDIGEPRAAADLTTAACERVRTVRPGLLLAWLEAARGETLAHLELRAESLHAFEVAAVQLDDASDESEGPYVLLDDVHLGRWRGHVLARLGMVDALPCLSEVVTALDSSFSRAGAGMHVDLAIAHLNSGDASAAHMHLEQAITVANQIGSHRQHARANKLIQRMGDNIS